MQRTQRDGVILIVLAIIGYSFLSVFTKTLFAQDVEPLDIAFWRFAFAALIYWVLVIIRAPRAPAINVRPLPYLKLMALGSLFGAEALAAFFGWERIPAGTFVVLFYSYPAMVAILEALLGERLSLLAWFALALTLVGIALTAPDFSAGLTGDNFVGVMMALFDGLCVAIYFIVSNRVMRGHSDMIRTSAWTVTGALIVIALLAVPHGMKLPQGESWLLLLAIAVISTVLPVFALNAGIQKLGATRSAIIATFEPLLTAVLALIFLGEVMLPIQWVGGAVIIASVILLQVRKPVSDGAEQTALAPE
ncbi:MAG: EamA family transporter [Chloroflexi bacterium]|nr:EamA family transporter [Chloroflexota bacterium]